MRSLLILLVAACVIPTLARAAPVMRSVQREWNAAGNEPTLRVCASDDVEAFSFAHFIPPLPSTGPKFSFGISVAAAATSAYWSCEAPAFGQRCCTYKIGAEYCAQGTAAACSAWIEDPHHVAPLPVLQMWQFAVIASKGDSGAAPSEHRPPLQMSAPMLEANVQCAVLPAGARAGSSGCPCRMFRVDAATVQEGSTCQ